MMFFIWDSSLHHTQVDKRISHINNVGCVWLDGKLRRPTAFYSLIYSSRRCYPKRLKNERAFYSLLINELHYSVHVLVVKFTHRKIHFPMTGEGCVWRGSSADRHRWSLCGENGDFHTFWRFCVLRACNRVSLFHNFIFVSSLIHACCSSTNSRLDQRQCVNLAHAR